MRRTFLAASILIAAALSALAIWRPMPIPAQPGGIVPPKQETPPTANAKKNNNATSLPITRVVLFNSGVGYFQREGEIEGNATVDFVFPASDINDLLKSMVLQDLGGGQVRTVSYDSFDPLEKSLKSFALDLTKNPSHAQLLQQARGEKVELDWQGRTLKGAILGVEKQRVPAGKDNAVEIDVLNVTTAEGLRSLPLKEVQRVRFLNLHLEEELKRAVEVLAFSHDTHKRTVNLAFTGEGKRQVRVGYVIENPIWKTSYRLVLNDNDKMLLQGWAIVDNATDDDWQNVRVALVSGRPISFQMNMYQPIYIPRPWVELELFANLRPQVHPGAMREPEAVRRLESFRKDAKAAFAAPAPPAKPFDIGQSIAPGATSGEVGEFFQYVIKEPVTLSRQRSSMLPIANATIEGKRFSLYNSSVEPKHPFLAVKLKNTTNLHLMQGPITVFEGESYAGDARILDLLPKEERLITFALDQGLEVEPVAKAAPDELRTIKIVKGILYATSKLRETKTYNVKNRSAHDRLLLIEHPFRADWKLAGKDEPVERTRDVYRFQVSVPAGKTASQEVVEEHQRTNQIILTTTDDQTIRFYLSSTVASPGLKKALETAISLKTKLADTQREIAQVEKQMRGIVEDQARIRANMERVPMNSPPYQRYLKKLDEQETQIEAFQAQIKTFRQREEEQRRNYETYLLGLNLE
ncbi:MAG TPA: DUF4139 domain-containing protein [Gemmataceae bacterium]|nr:DUF4139 domain-containing protein [Gemmataceae bacterium]